MRPEQIIADRGGIASSAQLRAAGTSIREIDRALAEGRIDRVRRGWYTTLPRTNPRVIATRHGGALTGLSALREHGCWAWHDPEVIDVLLPRGRRPPPRTDARVVMTVVTGFQDSAGLVPVEDALVHAIPRLPFEEAVAVLDWALHTGQVDPLAVHDVIARLPKRCRDILDWADPHCESVLESIVRTRLRLLGFHVTSQVPVDPLGQWGVLAFIDLVVDGVVALELDGKKDHLARFEQDRRKDAAITRGGRTALRASYSMVRDDWHLVEAAVRAAVAHCRGGAQRRRRHRAAPPA